MAEEDPGRKFIDLVLGSVGATLLVLGLGLWIVRLIATVGESVSGSDLLAAIADINEYVPTILIVTGFVLLGLWGFILTRRRAADEDEAEPAEGDEPGAQVEPETA